MLPKLYKRRFSNRSESPNTPIFHQQAPLASKSYNNRKSTLSNYQEQQSVISTICKDAVAIRSLNTRISKLSKDNDLLKSFILSTNIKNFSNNSKEFDSSAEMKKQFERLESCLY